MKDATIVFDLDGTLVDTAPDLIKATDHVLMHVGVAPVDPVIARSWISHGARYMIVQALDHADLTCSQSDIDSLLARFLDYYAANIAVHSRPYPGIVALLGELSVRGARLAVCTNKREGLARKLLDELSLSDRFAALAGRDTLATCKPDPGHVLGTIALAGGSPERAVMVGDSANDIEAARAAQIPSVAVSFGYTRTPAAELGADIVIDDYTALLSHLQTLLARSQAGL